MARHLQGDEHPDWGWVDACQSQEETVDGSAEHGVGRARELLITNHHKEQQREGEDERATG